MLCKWINCLIFVINKYAFEMEFIQLIYHQLNFIIIIFMKFRKFIFNWTHRDWEHFSTAMIFIRIRVCRECKFSMFENIFYDLLLHRSFHSSMIETISQKQYTKYIMILNDLTTLPLKCSIQSTLAAKCIDVFFKLLRNAVNNWKFCIRFEKALER